jgi:peptide/nickel transport system substrate-binding protein
MKRLRWQLLIVILALAAIGFLLLSQQPVQEQPQVAQQQAPEQPTSGGIYKEGVIGSFSRLNPILDTYNPADRDADRLIFSGLVRYDDRGAPQLDLADSWGISQDGTIYNFLIRSNAVWHDGTPVTSEDVLFTIDLMRNQSVPVPEDLREFWEQVEIKPLDEKTLQFILPEPFAPFLDYLTFGILPKHLLESIPPAELVNAPFNLKPVGTGPFQFDNLIVEDGKVSGVVLTAFEDYYAKKPFLQQIVLQSYPDSQTAMSAYDQGEVMGVSQVPSETLSQALNNPTLSLYTSRLPRQTLVYLNLDNPKVAFLQEGNVRRALLTGLNRQWMIDHLLSSQAIIADGPIFPGTWAYYDGMPRVEFDRQKAIALLREAEYTIPASGENIRAKDGQKLEFELVHPEDPTHTALAEAIQKDWAEVGVGVTLKAVPYEQLINDHLETGDYEAALVDIDLTRSPDPDPYPFWHQAQINGGQNYARWDDRQASEFLEQARVISNSAERARRYRNFQVRFSTELPALPLFYPVYNYAVDSQVQGVSVGPLYDLGDRFATVTSWFLSPRRETPLPPQPLPTP